MSRGFRRATLGARALVAAALVIAALTASARAAAADAKCDETCDAECQTCCESWQVVARCGAKTVAVTSTHGRSADAQRAAAELGSAAQQCSGGDCAAVNVPCEGGTPATWTAVCEGDKFVETVKRRGAAGKLAAQRRLIYGQLFAIRYAVSLLDALVARPDLKKQAAKDASSVGTRLRNVWSELKELDTKAAGAGADEAADKALLKTTEAATGKVAKDLRDALKLARDPKAIDANYAARIDQDKASRDKAAAREAKKAEEAAAREAEKAEKGAAAEKARQEKLLAEKKAEAAKKEAEIKKQEAAEAEAAKQAGEAQTTRAAAKQTLADAARAVDAALLTSVKFLAQRNLTKGGRSKAEQSRAKLEKHKKELGATFEQVQKPDTSDKAVENGRKLKKRAEELQRSIDAERKNLEKIIQDKASTQH